MILSGLKGLLSHGWANLGYWRSIHAATYFTRWRHCLLRPVQQRTAPVLVHGAFSDHKTNWEFVKPLFEKQFTIYAIARRGRGETDATVRNRSVRADDWDTSRETTDIGA